MYFGAVACPRPKHNFDGKIGLWMVGTDHVALKKSKFHDKGDVYMVSANMNGPLFLEIIRTKFLPAVKEKITWPKARVRVKLDSAGGHGLNQIWEEIVALGAKHKPPVEFEQQPFRSPDTNVLDLGVWHSTKTRVAVVKYDRSADKPMEIRIQEAVEAMWKDYPSEKLSNIFKTLPKIYECIINCNGGNGYSLPRK